MGSHHKDQQLPILDLEKLKISNEVQIRWPTGEIQKLHREPEINRYHQIEYKQTEQNQSKKNSKWIGLALLLVLILGSIALKFKRQSLTN